MNPSLLSTSIQLQSQKTGRPFLLDVTLLPDGKKKPVVIFAHGFKGFKDWGPFNLMANYFANRGFVFVKFNFSHNGTTIDDPLNFADLDAFGTDNHSIQLDDLAAVMDWITTNTASIPSGETDIQQIYLIGHSRGGSLVLLKAAEDARIKKVVTWAAVSDLLSAYSSKEIEDWKTKGVKWIPNSRTKQTMPVYYQYYEDLAANDQRLNVLKASASLRQPLLIIHAEKDEAVPLSHANAIHQQAKHSQLIIINDANHTFGGIHPFTAAVLPQTLKQLYDASIRFLT